MLMGVSRGTSRFSPPGALLFGIVTIGVLVG